MWEKTCVAELRNEGWETTCFCSTSTRPKELLADYAARADFVFHLAGVNRPQNPDEFYEGNRGFTEAPARTCWPRRATKRLCSSPPPSRRSWTMTTAKASGRLKSLLFAHERATGAPALVYRLPGVFGKWCRPSYNSVVATFCHNIANGLPIDVRDPAYSFPLVYIDDVVASFIAAMEGGAPRGTAPFPAYCHLMCDAYDVTLGRLAELIESFRGSRGKLDVPDMGDAFTRKLYATYLSYLPDRRLLLSAGHALRCAWQLHRVPAHPGARAGRPSTFPGPAS